MIVAGLIRLGVDDPQPQLALRPPRAGARAGRARDCPGSAPRETARCGRAGTGRPGGWRRWRGRAPDRPAPVSESGIASCACASRRPCSRRRRAGRDSHPKTSAVIVRNQASASTASAAASRAARRRAHAARARDVGKLAVGRLVHAGDRDAVVGRDQAVAGVDQLRRGGVRAGEQPRHAGGACLGLRVRGEGRLRHRAGDRGVADDVDAGLQLRLERHRVDRAPAGAIGDAGQLGDAAGLLRRDDVGDLRLVVAEVGDQRAGRARRPR